MKDSDRIERLLAMILVQDMRDAPQTEKAVALNRAGFSNAESAELLGTTAAVVGQQLYAQRSVRRTTRKRTAGKRVARKKPTLRKATRKKARRGRR